MAIIATRKRKQRAAELALLRDLLPEIWGCPRDVATPQLQALLDHYQCSRSSIYEDYLLISERSKIKELVSIVKSKRNVSLQDMKAAVIAARPECLDIGFNNATVINAMDFAIRLWLFIEPAMRYETLTLEQIVQQKLPKHGTSQGVAGKCLSPDFSAKSLTRRAGFRLLWTSDLSQHLILTGDSQLHIFRHASILHKYARSDEEYASQPKSNFQNTDVAQSDFFPPGFLEETERTLGLLFQPAKKTNRERIRRISHKDGVDLEAAIELQNSYQLSAYPYWQERLLLIQEKYDRAKPKRVKQWWFDRRNKVEWATFWIAIVVFILTLTFGLISSVTGIMQVWIAYNSP